MPASPKCLNIIDLVCQGKFDEVEYNRLSIKDVISIRSACPNFLEDTITNNQGKNLPRDVKKFSLSRKSTGTGEDKIIHFVSRKQKFNNIPKDIITSELLSLKGDQNQTVYHILSKNGASSLLDEKFWTREHFLDRDTAGVTPLHSLVKYDTTLIISALKKKEINFQDLLIKDENGGSPLSNWAGNKHWQLIPQEFLTKEFLEMAHRAKIPTLNILIEQFQSDWRHKNPEPTEKEKTILKTKLQTILKEVDQQSLAKLCKTSEKIVSSMAKNERAKRKVLKTISENSKELQI